MRRVMQCRRTFVALVGMVMLFALGYSGREQVSGALVTVVMAIAVANSAEATLKSRAGVTDAITKS